MTLRIGAETPGGLAIGGEVVGGLARGPAVVFRAAAAPPVDRAGTLNAGVTRQGRNSIFASVLSDPDGIRSVDAARVESRTGGRRANIDFVRQDARSFTHADNRANSDWRAGTMTVTYTDGNGVQTTLTDDWNVA